MYEIIYLKLILKNRSLITLWCNEIKRKLNLSAIKEKGNLVTLGWEETKGRWDSES